MDYIKGKTLEQLFALYGDEQQRIDQRDREETQQHIRSELMRRLKRAMDELKTTENGVDARVVYEKWIQNRL